MGGNVGGSIDEDEAGEVAHSIQQVSITAVVGDVAWRPKVHVKDVEWTTERPGKDKLTVAPDSAVGGDAVRTFEDPIGNVFSTEGPKEPKADAVQSFVYTHVAGCGGCMISRENRTAQRSGYNNQHQQFSVILDVLKYHEAMVDDSDAVAADVIAVGSMDRREGKSV